MLYLFHMYTKGEADASYFLVDSEDNKFIFVLDYNISKHAYIIDSKFYWDFIKNNKINKYNLTHLDILAGILNTKSSCVISKDIRDTYVWFQTLNYSKKHDFIYRGQYKELSDYISIYGNKC